MQPILKDAEKLRREIVRLRRDFHMHPELSQQEERTAGVVELTLRQLNIQTRRVAETGVVGILTGKWPGRTVAIRADMDALPLQDDKITEYASQEPGKMHACGHDAHTAILLGAAMLLCQYRDDFAGTVKFFFQPAEEDGGGAEPMIEAGVMENPHVDAVFGLHVSHEIATGKIGVHPGKFYAACDTLDIVVRGKESHGARPHSGVDAILAASHIVTALQSFVSRNVNPVDSAVVTVGMFNGGYQRNIIADKVELGATVRTLTPEVRKQAQDRLPRLVSLLAESFGATAEVHYELGYPPLVNDPGMTEFVRQSAAELLGGENVELVEQPFLGGEDFAFFLQRAPGSFFQLGIRNEEKGTIQPIHTHLFDIDEDALVVGSAMHAKLALDFLRGGAERS